MYAEPARPLGKVVGERVIVGQATVSEYARVPAQPLASVAVTVKLNAPVTVGVPKSVPPAVSVKPFGKAPVVTANP